MGTVTPAFANNVVTFKLSNADIYDSGYNQSFTSVLTATETGGGTPGIPFIQSSTPGSGFTCGAPTTSTATTASCTIEAAPGPSNGDDSGVIGANGTSNSLVVADTDNTSTTYTGAETMIIYPAPVCGAAPDGTGSYSGTTDTMYDTGGGTPVAEACYDGASGPASALLTGISSAGGTIFLGSNPIDAAGGTALTIMAGPGFNWTGSVGSGEADVDTGTAGLNKQVWTDTNGTTAPPLTANLTSASTVASEASFKSSGDPENTCPPQQALIDAGMPYCFEEFETTGSGPSAGQVAVAYTGQNLPTAQAPTVALNASSASIGQSINITDASNACPASMGAGTTNFLFNTYNCWYARAGDATPVSVTVGGVAADVTSGGVSEGNYTVGTSSTVTYATVTSGSNQVSTTTGPSTPGSVPSSFSSSLIGDGVSGTGIPTGTEVTAVNGTSVTLSNAATANGAGTVTKVATTSGSNLVSVTASSVPANFYPALVGATVTGTGIPTSPPTTVTAETPTSLTLSANATATSATGVTLTFNPSPETVTFYPVNLDPPQLNASFTVANNTPTGSQPVEVCEATTPTNGNDWEFGVQWMTAGGSLQYVNGNSGPTEICATGTIDVSTDTTATTTTPTDSSIVLGGSNTDNAVVAGSDPNENPVGDPTGSVSFTVCGPTAIEEPAVPCTATDYPVGSAVGLSPTGTATSASFTPTATGYWCFDDSYSGDANYGPSSDDTTDECFDVGNAATTTVTTPTSSDFSLGGSVSDGATVSGNAAGGSPTGSVTFYQCGPTATAQPCTSQADPVGNPVGVTGGAGDTATATSASVTPGAAGYWCFAGYYSGDSNYSGSADTSTDECFDVLPVITSATTTTFSEGVPGSFQVTSPLTGTTTFTETGALPSGVTLSSGGVLSGTPGFVAGSFQFTITATDIAGDTANQVFTLYVTPSSVLHVTTSSLPGAQIGVSYSATLGAAGGKPPYKWSLSSGTLPKGLKLTKHGVIKGKPAATAVSETFTVKVTDKTHPTPQTATATFTITVS
jgi:hypothetical protein